MSDADELLLAGLPTTTVPDAYTQPPKASLGSRLRAERTKRNIPLTQIDLAIGVHMTYVQAMEEDRFSHLPRGRMAEEMITKYVSYLGLDVKSALEEYGKLQYSELVVEPLTAYGTDKLHFFHMDERFVSSLHWSYWEQSAGASTESTVTASMRRVVG
jgi:cytoskeletal protein RodZ